MTDSEVQAPLSINLNSIWGFVQYRYLILANQNFIVFIDDELDVDWKTTDRFDQESSNDRAQQAKIINKAAIIESADRDPSNEKKTISFKRQIGEAIARGLEGHFEEANEMLLAAEKCCADELRARKEAIQEQIAVKNKWQEHRKMWTILHYVLGILALIFSSLSAAKTEALGLTTAMTAWLAWLAVIFTAMLTFLSPERKSNKYARAWSVLNNQITRYQSDYNIQVKDVVDSYNEGESIIFDTDVTRKLQ